MGFAVWIDTEEPVAWAQGTHEYRPMGTAVIALTSQFRNADFAQTRASPLHLRTSFAGFFGSLETVNEFLQSTGCFGVAVALLGVSSVEALAVPVLQAQGTQNGAERRYPIPAADI